MPLAEEDYERTWTEFWQPLLKENGDFFDNVKRELHNFRMLMLNASKVYYTCTGGQVTKSFTDPDVAIQAIRDFYASEYGQGNK